MKLFKYFTLATAMMMVADGASSADWTNSAYGKNDEIGAANLLTPEIVQQAVKLVKTGKTYPRRPDRQESAGLPSSQLQSLQHSARTAGGVNNRPQQVHLQ